MVRVVRRAEESVMAIRLRIVAGLGAVNLRVTRYGGSHRVCDRPSRILGTPAKSWCRISRDKRRRV